MGEADGLIPAEGIEDRILLVRGQRVILDSDLAALYGVETYRLKEQVKRNAKRFPPDFVFVLTPLEVTGMRSQIAIASKRNIRHLPMAFTEHGAIQAANVLRSERAMEMSVLVVRAFVRMRRILGGRRELATKLAELEETLTERLDTHEVAIVDVLHRIMELLDPPQDPASPEIHRRKIGFGS